MLLGEQRGACSWGCPVSFTSWGGVGSPMELGSPGDWDGHSPPVLFWGREWALMVLVSISSQDLPPAS